MAKKGEEEMTMMCGWNEAALTTQLLLLLL